MLVLGSGGAGKSTLSAALAQALALPCVHLDRAYWQPGWTPTPPDAWRQRVAQLADEPAWVMDGNFSDTLPTRLERAQAVVWLDLPRSLCLSRVLRRVLRQWGQVRPDMAPGCPEQPDLAFLEWVWAFPRRSRPRVAALLAQSGLPVACFTRPESVNRWMRRVRRSSRLS